MGSPENVNYFKQQDAAAGEIWDSTSVQDLCLMACKRSCLKWSAVESLGPIIES